MTNDNVVIARKGWEEALKDPKVLSEKLAQWHRDNPPRPANYHVTEKGRRLIEKVLA